MSRFQHFHHPLPLRCSKMNQKCKDQQLFSIKKKQHIIKVQVKNMRLSYVLLRKDPVRLDQSDMFGTREAATLNDDCIPWCDGEGSGGGLLSCLSHFNMFFNVFFFPLP